MKNTTENILKIHYGLWDYRSSIEVDDEIYTISISEDLSYTYTTIPNANGTKFLWITNSLNDPNESTRKTLLHYEKNEIMKVTWVKSLPHFTNAAIIQTIHYPHKKEDIHIEKLSSYGNQIIFSTYSSLKRDVYD